MKSIYDLDDTPIENTQQVVDEHMRKLSQLVETVDEFQARVDKLTAQDRKPSVNKHRRVYDEKDC